ncbi:hypothetical protein AFL01nite_12290 [Aeromicrobium flavum]|uniref:Glycosyl hydrolase family 43 n=1 Tax=Aeromicrobium flavum TaxID=416568 RepID=A0A512HTX3_9ACTN|nr:family 43 glycosylhydrolase [Aeromicrobium flavum]GEO88902.1 hypothetical protein AFL01nite_12290 [Aeromicrobium flavum]
MRNLYTRVATAGATALAVLATGALVAPAAQAAPDQPILKSWANPGVAEVPGGGFVMLRTGRWDKAGVIRTAAHPRGPWKSTKERLLKPAPKWANPKKRGVWAPSIVRGATGTWVVYYSALVRGSTTTRCIGTGTAKTHRGPFKPARQPIACWRGNKKTKPQDPVGGKRRIGLIDATPAVVGGRTVLLFKTQRSYKKNGTIMWDTSTRMLNLDPVSPHRVIANPVNQKPRSVQLIRKRHRYIEENPVMVERGGTFTLFTSWGWYGTPKYWTQYRQSTDPWRGWSTKPTRLTFPKGTNTLGRGNAQAVGDSLGRWWFFWNGHRPNFKRKEGPKYLYVGRLDWNAANQPYVQRVLKKA